MREAVMRVVREIPDCSFVNLCRAIPGADGDEVIYAPGFGNLVLWVEVSVPIKTAVLELERDGEIEFKEASFGAYHIDGFVLPLPLARGWRSYARPRWLPVRLYPVDQVRGKRS